MDNQHRKIKGYRELSQEEIDLINEIKAEGVRLEALQEKVKQFNLGFMQSSHEADGLTQQAESFRWAAIAKTDFQTGLMALTRAVAKPTFF